MVKKIFIALIIAFAVFVVASAFTSCSAVKKNSSSVKIDSVSVHKTDSVKTFSKDSTATRKTDSSVSRKKDSSVTSISITTSGLTVTFDTTKSDKPIKIITSGDTTTIDAGGRGVKKIAQKNTGKNKNKTEVKGSENNQVKKADSTGLKAAGSVSKTQVDSTNLKKNNKTKTVDRRKPAMIFFEVLIAAAAVFGLIYVFNNYAISLKLAPPFLTLTKKAK